MELDEQITPRILKFHTWTKSCEERPLGTLCQKNWGANRGKWEPVETFDRTSYRTL
jgi:hypothetical protein